MTDSPEREQISRELAEELGFDYPESWEFHIHHTVRDALISREVRVRGLEADNGYLKQLLKCDPDETIEDGFGSKWSRTCPTCGLGTVHVNRPGEVQCDYCG